jgi:hypothetical protein
MFHPIHFTALVTVLIVSGSIWLSHALQTPWIFVVGCLILPHVMSIGRFDERPEADERPHDYGDEPKAGFLANLKEDR